MDINGADFTDLNAVDPVQKYAFIFVCQQGRLEIQALLLAASLKRYLKCEYELIAVVPEPIMFMGAPRDESLAFLSDLGVRVEIIQNDLMQYAHEATAANFYANKIYCFGVKTDADKLVFLDSDVLCFKDFFGDARYRIPFNAKLVGMAGVVTAIGKWEQLYELVNVPLPKIRLKVIGTEEGYPDSAFVPPYFNSGFVAVHSDLAVLLRDTWLDCFKAVRDSGILDIAFLAEQVSLPLAVHRMGLVFDVLKVQDLPTCHYHRLKQLEANPELLRLAKDLVFCHPALRKIVKSEPEWCTLAAS